MFLLTTTVPTRTLVCVRILKTCTDVPIIKLLYRMSGAFMSILQDLIPAVITIQKCHMNICPILNSYGVMDIK